LKIDTVTTPARRMIPRSVRGHLFMTAFVVFALLGGGLRFIPTSAAAPAGSNAAGGAASTACNAS
jgi:hypothetical protein